MSVLSDAMIIGITGGIASGKSTVVGEIARAGYQIIDADQVVHDLQTKGGKLYAALVDWLGESILNQDGELNRPVLSQLIFSNPENRQRSAQIQNDIIRQELADRRNRLAQTEPVFFMDLPLLFELHYEDWFDQIWLVFLDKDRQVERLTARNNLTIEEAQQRLDSQMPLADKKKMADIIIDNNGSLAETIDQVQNLLAGLKQKK